MESNLPYLIGRGLSYFSRVPQLVRWQSDNESLLVTGERVSLFFLAPLSPPEGSSQTSTELPTKLARAGSTSSTKYELLRTVESNGAIPSSARYLS